MEAPGRYVPVNPGEWELRGPGQEGSTQDGNFVKVHIIGHGNPLPAGHGYEKTTGKQYQVVALKHDGLAWPTWGELIGREDIAETDDLDYARQRAVEYMENNPNGPPQNMLPGNRHDIYRPDTFL